MTREEALEAVVAAARVIRAYLPFVWSGHLIAFQNALEALEALPTPEPLSDALAASQARVARLEGALRGLMADCVPKGRPRTRWPAFDAARRVLAEGGS